MGSVALNFVGGVPFQGLHEVVKMAVHKSRKFKAQLVNLEFTLRCLHSPTLEEIRNNYVRLNLPADTVVDLRQKVIEGKALVSDLSDLSLWNIRIWGNCCYCIDYAKELDELDRTLWSLLELLQLEQVRNMGELLCLARAAKHRQDDLERKQGEVLTAVQELGEKMDDILATLKEQQNSVSRIIPNSVQEAPSSSGGGTAVPALGVVFRQLVDVVVQVKVQNMMFRRLLGTFKFTLFCLQPLIEELVEHGRVVHLPKPEVEKLIMQLVSGVELVQKCSKVRKHANYRKYKFTEQIFNLEEYVSGLFNELKGQVERTLKETMDSAKKMEMAIQKFEAEVCEIQLLELPSPAVGFGIFNGQAHSDVTEKTLLDSSSIKGGGVLKQLEGSSDVPPELSSPTDGLDILNMQGSLDLITTNNQVVATESKEIGGSLDLNMQYPGKIATDQPLPPWPAAGLTSAKKIDVYTNKAQNNHNAQNYRIDSGSSSKGNKNIANRDSTAVHHATEERGVNRPPEKRQRVPSAYNQFIKEEIQRIKVNNPDISNREAFSTAAKNWGHFPHIHFGLMLETNNQAKLDNGSEKHLMSRAAHALLK